jgi:hypothetical protein
MNILILIIFTRNHFNNIDNEIVYKMLNIQRTYHNKINNVTSYFIEFRRDQENDIEIDGDFIYIKGDEHILNILDKTIKAVEYLINIQKYNFDYLIRTNISSIINIPLLISYCEKLPRENIYTGANIENLQWIDYRAGIYNTDYRGTIYPQGICIIFSYDIINEIIINKDKLNYNIVDDVSFGIYINKYKPNLVTNIDKFKCSFIVISNKINNNDINNYILYRNRNNDRNIDVENMKYITNAIYLNE